MRNELRPSADLSELYYKWLGIPAREQPPNHYRLLGLALFEHDGDVIESAADRQMTHVRSQAGGPHAAESQQVLNEIAAAKVCLLNEKRKAEYDAQLRSKLAMEKPNVGVAPAAESAPIPVRPIVPRRAKRPVVPPPPTNGFPQTLVWGGVAIVSLVVVLMFLAHLVKLGLAAWREQPKEIVSIQPQAPAPVLVEPNPPKQPMTVEPQVIVKDEPVIEPSMSPPEPPKPQAPLPAIAPFGSEEAKVYQEDWATFLGKSSVATNSLGMNLVLIPPGEFDMGSNEQEIARWTEEIQLRRWPPFVLDDLLYERPQHHVRITKAFLIAQHEVTVRDFRKFIQATGHKTEAETSGKGSDGFLNNGWITRPKYSWSNLGKFPLDDTQPVVNVSWNDSAKFCEWLSKKEEKKYRLPTEAEWEHACRAGTTTAWSFGEDPKDIMQYVAFGVTLCPVGRRRPNPFGLFDMHGGVQEWVSDWFSPFSREPQTDPTGPEIGEVRIRRGGHNGANHCLVRSAAREPAPTSHRAFFIGFRVACEVEATE